MKDRVRVVVVGAGERGTRYAEWIAAHPDRAQVVAVCEPDPLRRARFVAAFPGVTEHATWTELPTEPIADAAVVCTQDRDHVEPAIACLERGYDVLLEKPIAPELADVERVCDAAERSGRIFAVCHVLRYTPYTLALRALLAAGAIGEVVSVQHLEPVGWYHMAHSFVRGNWRREDESSFMLLAKSCHDVDWLGHVIDRPLERVSSFGSLTHFRPEQAPEGAALRCLDCPLQHTCAYSATRIYLDTARAGHLGWPVSVALAAAGEAEQSVDAVERVLRTGPYGRCVYHCDNDVVDHQVATLEYAGGVTATFQMLAFTDMGYRRTQVFGTQGELTGDGESIAVFDFRTQQRRVIGPDEIAATGDASAGGGHGGGDWGLFDAFVSAVAAGEQSLISTGAAATRASHRAVFAIEQARRSGTVVDLRASA